MNFYKLRLFAVLTILTNLSLFSQVGIGTTTPVAGSSLHIEGSNSGVLINRVVLTGTDDITTIASLGASQEGLMVYNTNTTNNVDPDTDVTPGFYYWTGSKWQSSAEETKKKTGWAFFVDGTYLTEPTGLDISADTRTIFENDGTSGLTNTTEINDLSLTKLPNEYINTLNQLTAPKFTKTRYPSGIVFNECIKSSPIRFTGYGKEYEMQLNKTFYSKYPQLLGGFDNVLRIESRLSKPSTIKKYFGSNQLLDILNSSNLNYQILNKIIYNQTKFNPLMNAQHMKNTEEKNLAYIYYLNDKYNGDFNSIFNHLKSRLGSKTKATYQRKQTLKYLAMINNANDDYCKENIEEIKSALKESV